MPHLLPLLIIVTTLVHMSTPSPDAARLFEDLLAHYHKLVRPVRNASHAVQIQFKMKIIQISDVHEKNQVVTINGWLVHIWHDYRLTWDPRQYNGLETMHIPGELLWLPDIILYNNAHGSPHVTTVTKAAVYSNGVVVWEPPVIYNFLCQIDIEWFPYDEQFCSMKYGSWTYYGTHLDMVHPYNDEVEVITDEHNETYWEVALGADITEYQTSGEWDLMSVVSQRHEKWYICCDYPYVDITYKINIRRKTLFYSVNLVTPCVGITFLTCLVFYLPSDSNSKIALCVSILVTLTVFFLLLVEIIPPTSIKIPLIGRYLVFTMIMVTLSVGCTVGILNIHYCASVKPVPRWARVVFIDWMPRLLLVRRPARLNSLEKKYAVLKSAGIAKAFLLEAMPLMPRKTATVQLRDRDRARSQYYKERQAMDEETTANNNNEEEEEEEEFTQPTVVKTKIALNVAKLRACKNVIFIAQHLQRKTTEKNFRDDWKFVAIVIDRLFLWIFSFVIVVGTVKVVLMAPTLWDSRAPITQFSARDYIDATNDTNV